MIDEFGILECEFCVCFVDLLANIFLFQKQKLCDEDLRLYHHDDLA